MSNIPKARDLLVELSNNIYAGTISQGEMVDTINDVILPLMTREKYTRKAAPRSKPMDGITAAAIRTHAMQHPGKSMHEIARVFDVNPGRVSEALAPHREKSMRHPNEARIRSAGV